MHGINHTNIYIELAIGLAVKYLNTSKFLLKDDMMFRIMGSVCVEELRFMHNVHAGK